MDLVDPCVLCGKYPQDFFVESQKCFYVSKVPGCLHSFCGECRSSKALQKSLFSCASCGKELSHSKLIQKSKEDIINEIDLENRQYVRSVFNQVLEDFNGDLVSYNEYEEKVEDMIDRLNNGIDSENIKQQIYMEDLNNKKIIQKNEVNRRQLFHEWKAQQELDHIKLQSIYQRYVEDIENDAKERRNRRKMENEAMLNGSYIPHTSLRATVKKENNPNMKEKEAPEKPLPRGRNVVAEFLDKYRRSFEPQLVDFVSIKKEQLSRGAIYESGGYSSSIMHNRNRHLMSLDLSSLKINDD